MLSTIVTGFVPRVIAIDPLLFIDPLPPITAVALVVARDSEPLPRLTTLATFMLPPVVIANELMEAGAVPIVSVEVP